MKRKPYKAPYSVVAGWVYDENDMHCLTIRGWGALTGTGGGLAIPEDKASEIQDAFAEHVARVLSDNPFVYADEGEANEGV